jgi:hypothetical protein
MPNTNSFTDVINFKGLKIIVNSECAPCFTVQLKKVSSSFEERRGQDFAIFDLQYEIKPNA